MRILLIEDEIKMANFIARGLREEHYVVDVANKGEEGGFLASVNPYDLIILDVMLPDKNGFLICRELRQKKIPSPILLLTARDSIKDKVTGLDAGADDYLAKPFAFEELLARIRAISRRGQTDKSTTLKLADLELDQLTHKVKRGGKPIELTPKEYALLEYFMLHPNEVVTRTMIAEHVWNEDFDSFTNVFDVYVYRLRAKIDTSGAKPLLHSLRGVGYILKEN
jgi:two-component system, OmpR family, copper resistance phosphate regulon response regulator CusR